MRMVGGGDVDPLEGDQWRQVGRRLGPPDALQRGVPDVVGRPRWWTLHGH